MAHLQAKVPDNNTDNTRGGNNDINVSRIQQEPVQGNTSDGGHREGSMYADLLFQNVVRTDLNYSERLDSLTKVPRSDTAQVKSPTINANHLANQSLDPLRYRKGQKHREITLGCDNGTT